MGPHCTVRLECLLVATWMTLTLEPIKGFVQYLHCGWSSLALWSCSVTFRGCAIQSTGGFWSMILFGRAVCGTLGGGFPEKPLPFEWTVRWAFLLGLCWCFKPPFQGLKSSHSGCLWLTVWLLWTATGDTIGLFRSSSCSSGRDIAHGRVFRCWSPLDLDIALELARCYGFLLAQ